MSTARQTLLQVVLLFFGGIVASACAQENAPGGPIQTRSDIILNDLAYEVSLGGSVPDLDPRVRSALADLELDVARAVGTGSEGERQYRAGMVSELLTSSYPHRGLAEARSASQQFGLRQCEVLRS